MFGENLRWFRCSRGMTQAELARLIRVNRRVPCRSYVTRLEGGGLDPRLSTVRSIARALKVKPWYLVAEPSDNVDFWRGYLDLSPVQKREIQRLIKWKIERRG